MTVKLLGDPHLGRRFNKGVALARRGEREAMIREDFVRQLNPDGATTHICMGDLFDKPQVPYEVLAFAAATYTHAAQQHWSTMFYIIQGNHDDSRDLDEVTAWDIFCRLMVPLPNVVCVTEPLAVEGVGLLLPWNPTRTAVEQLDLAIQQSPTGFGTNPSDNTAYGHWDVDLRTAGHNIIPTKELADLGITKTYTGHVHLPDQFVRDGVTVQVVGSMQPYAQGEDGLQSAEVRYETVTLERLQEILEVAPQNLSNVCVRLQLQPGEQFEGTVDCRSFDVQRMRPVDIEAPADVSMDGFEISLAYQKALDGHTIIPAVREKIDTRWTETFSNGG